MAYTFDSLGYAKRLRDGGVPRDQAEAHAEAAQDFIMAELVTKADLLATKQDLQTEFRGLFAGLRGEFAELRGEFAELRGDFHQSIAGLRNSIAEVRGELRSSVAEHRGNIGELRSNMDTQTLRLTVRLGVMLAAGIAILATIMKLTQ